MMLLSFLIMGGCLSQQAETFITMMEGLCERYADGSERVYYFDESESWSLIFHYYFYVGCCQNRLRDYKKCIKNHQYGKSFMFNPRYLQKGEKSHYEKCNNWIYCYNNTDLIGFEIFECQC